MIDWTHVLIAAIAGLPATIAAIGAILMGFRNGNKTDAVATKLDDNTALTVMSGEAANSASIKAEVAAVKAGVAATKAEDAVVQKVDLLHGIQNSLNGGLASAIEKAIAPLKESIQQHAEIDERNMQEVRDALSQMRGKG